MQPAWSNSQLNFNFQISQFRFVAIEAQKSIQHDDNQPKRATFIGKQLDE
jgi:hypothetical protein